MKIQTCAQKKYYILSTSDQLPFQFRIRTRKDDVTEKTEEAHLDNTRFYFLIVFPKNPKYS